MATLSLKWRREGWGAVGEVAKEVWRVMPGEVQIVQSGQIVEIEQLNT